MNSYDPSNCFQNFKSDVSCIELPKKFTFPFVYEPAEIALKAADELKKYLVSNEWNHNFGSNLPSLPALGKMFGVLVVKSSKGDLGYLSAFSGKLGEEVLINNFVPPIFDRLAENSYFLKVKETLNIINNRVDLLEVDPVFSSWKEILKKDTEYCNNVILKEKEQIKKNKVKRGEKKANGIEREELAKLNNESLQELSLIHI